MPSPGMGAIASLDYTKEERQKLAKKSHEFECPECGKVRHLLQEPSHSDDGKDADAVQAEAREIASQVIMKGEMNTDIPARETRVEEQPSSVDRVLTASNSQQYNYFIAAILVVVAVLLFRRFVSVPTDWYLNVFLKRGRQFIKIFLLNTLRDTKEWGQWGGFLWLCIHSIIIEVRKKYINVELNLVYLLP